MASSLRDREAVKKYKYLIPVKNHPPIETLMKESWGLSSAIATAFTSGNMAKFKNDFPIFYEKTGETQKAYEDARLSEIQRLYSLLNKEIRI